MNKSFIYADHAATTSLSSAALEAMEPWLQNKYGNPSTLYSLARDPRKAISIAREKIATAIGALPEEIFFTSGGTEADNWAIKGTAFRNSPGDRIITSPIEHHAVLNSCAAMKNLGYQIAEVSVNHEGIISKKSLEKEISKGAILTSIMLANNEIGTIEPIRELSAITHQMGCSFHTDAVQAVGHIPINVKELGVDMLSASAHKFNGPKGIGFLYIRSGTEIAPLIDGGSQEHGMRAGTENVASIIGMATALEEHVSKIDEEISYLNGLSEQFLEALKGQNLKYIINGSSLRIPGSISVSFYGIDGEMLIHRLDLMGIAVSTGSACNSRKTVLSHVLQAIGTSNEYAYGTLRITLGMDNSGYDVQKIAKQIGKIISES